MGKMQVVWMVVCCLLVHVESASVSSGDSDVLWGEVHSVVSSECKPYFAFQTLAMVYSHKRVRQIGPLTRIMGCTAAGLSKFTREDLEMIDTHITPVYTVDPETKDRYLPYNRPGGLLHWYENTNPKEEWIFILDPDMMFRHPVTPKEWYVEEGWARASHYHYLIGASNSMALTHVPEIEPRKDKLGGPPGRRADYAGAPYFLRTKDAEKIARSWMNYTRTVRHDPEAWYLAGYRFARVAVSVWIAEMYGWIYAAAKANIWHVLDPLVQIYPNTEVMAAPSIIHYGLNNTVPVNDYYFHKFNHRYFDHKRCPPWNLKPNRSIKDDAGLIPHPPFPHEVKEKNLSARYGILLAIETVTTINQALCERHRRLCRTTQELMWECRRVDSTRLALEKEFEKLDRVICRDKYPLYCTVKKMMGECKKDWLYMAKNCSRSCEFCPHTVYSRDGWDFANMILVLHEIHVGAFPLACLVFTLVMGIVVHLLFFSGRNHQKHLKKRS